MEAKDFDLHGAIPDFKIAVVDSTLRAGEQSLKSLVSLEEKKTIAKYLNQIGVEQIEAGAPFRGKYEKDRLQCIVRLGLDSSIMSWNRATISDLKASLECGVDAVTISIPAEAVSIQADEKNARQEVMNRIADTVKFAKDNQLYVAVHAENASVFPAEILTELALLAQNYGADRFGYGDKAGILKPQTAFRNIKALYETVKIDIEINTYNHLGLATANALAGVYAGAKYIKVALNGWGGEAGISSLQEVVMSIKHLMHIEVPYNTALFKEAAEYAASAFDRPLLPITPVVGNNIFSHESGIHGDGILKNPSTYEPFSPQEVGSERQLVIGKHSGSAAVRAKFRELGIDINDLQARNILKRARQMAIDKKRSLSDKELLNTFQEFIKEMR